MAPAAQREEVSGPAKDRRPAALGGLYFADEFLEPSDEVRGGIGKDSEETREALESEAGSFCGKGDHEIKN